jgi:hypothetical protein
MSAENHGVKLQPIRIVPEAEAFPAILNGIVKIPHSNYGAGLAERVTTV